MLYRCVKGNRRKVIKNKNEILEYIKNSNESAKEIAKKFNVSQGTISN
ncbi:ArsR family transcriptional regulator [Clostridium massiliamazoniense]